MESHVIKLKYFYIADGTKNVPSVFLIMNKYEIHVKHRHEQKKCDIVFYYG